MEITKANTKTLYSIYRNKVKEPVDYNTFKLIIQEFHKELIPKILEGYKFTPYSKLGEFLVILNFRKKRSEKYIDWGKSNKRKAEILARKGTLYEEWWEKDGVRVIGTDIPEGSIKVNNNGEKWVIHFNDTYYFNWSWHKNGFTKYTRHITKYLFKATRANKRAISSIIDKNDSPELTYVIHKQKSKQ